MEIKFNCPKCGQKLEVDTSAGGATVNCPNCSQPLIMPMVVSLPPAIPAGVPPAAPATPPPPPPGWASRTGSPYAPRPHKPKPVGLIIGITAAVVVGGILMLFAARAVLLPALRVAREQARLAKERVTSGQVIRATDGSTEVTVPFGWSAVTNLSPAALLQAACPAGEEYLMVMTEKKSDYPGMTLEGYSSAVRNQQVAKMPSVKQSGPTELQVNGCRAIQYVLSGTVTGKGVTLALTYQATFLEDATQFHQVLTWTLQSRFEQYRDDLQKIAASFKSRAGAASVASGPRSQAGGPGRQPARSPQPGNPGRAATAAAANDAKGGRTRMVGWGLADTNWQDFSETRGDGAMLIGFQVGLGKFVRQTVVHSIRPIYRTSQGEVSGQLYGISTNTPIVVKAKPGYAVGGISVKGGLNINGFSATFMRINGDALDPSDSYTSDWMGGTQGASETPLAGTGAPVAGIFGRLNPQHTLGGLGLMLPEKAAAAGGSTRQ